MLKPSVASLEADLKRLPKTELGFYPTPLERLPNLEVHLGGPRLLMKREDLSGLALGGNKVRMLEYVLGHAQAKEADIFIAGGGKAQSNHGRLCAAAARRCGLKPVIVLNEDPHVPREMQANLLVDYLLGAELHLIPQAELKDGTHPRFVLQPIMEKLAQELRESGHHPYVLPTSSVPRATLGFVEGALELYRQLEKLEIDGAHIYVTSTGSTQAGLLLAAKYLELPWTITGVSCSPSSIAQENVQRLVNGAAELLGIDLQIERSDVANEDYSGQGYGIPSVESLEALRMLAELEGIFLDPVYTSKGMAAIFDHVRRGHFTSDDTVIFVHTGGTPTNFAYAKELGEGFSYFDNTRMAEAPL